jgi:mxaL protein
MKYAEQWRIAAALVFLLLSVFLPEVKVPRKTYDYMVTFDITQSMNVDDVTLGGAPVRRIALARAAMRDVLHHLPCGSKVGWSIFAGYRSFILLSPIEVCSNYEVLLASLDRIDDRMRWANASNIAKGAYWTIRNAQELKESNVVFITDGQEAPPEDLDKESDSANADGTVHGVLVGVGGDVPVRIPKTNADGEVLGYWSSDEVTQPPNATPGQSQEHLSALRENYLETLAAFNKLDYARLTTPDSLTRVLLNSKLAHKAKALTDIRWVAAAIGLLIMIWNYVPFKAILSPAGSSRGRQMRKAVV